MTERKIPEDFAEIAHCGGRLTIHVEASADGRRKYQLSWHHARPNSAAIFAVYALPQGIPVETIKMGGIGQPWNEPPIAGCFPVFISSDSQGFFGHQCPSCNGYWRAPGGAICPYCRTEAKGHEFLTDAQRRYVQEFCHQLTEALESDVEGDLIIDMDAVADAVGKDGEKPPFYYSEEAQQNLFKCEACGERNDILGTFGYCSSCGTRNDLQELRVRMDQLRERINNGPPHESHVRDAVAAFDSFSALYVTQLLELVPLTPARRDALSKMRFHALRPAVELVKSAFDIDVYRHLQEEERQFAEVMFHRRHVYEHRGGEADEKYIMDSGDTSVRPKQALRETLESAHRVTTIVLKMAKNLHDGFHQIIEPREEPIRRYSAYRKSTTNVGQ